jgi:hypothetical protein
MRPGHLNVFDGLRMTTEHMNYLQGSFQSAVQDLRGILGLGVVHQGFEVVAEGNGVIVQPGLAFDQQGNRIVLDTPATIETTFAAGENTKYVCVKYDQIEDGEVEGRFTLVWDSCSVVLMPELPAPEDNLVALARVDRVGGNGLVEVRKIVRAAPIEPASAEPAAGAEEPVAGAAEEPASEAAAEEPAPAAPPEQPTVRMAVRQGVARLSNKETKASVGLDFELLSLSCHTVFTATRSSKATEEEEAKAYSYSTCAHGEATFATDGVSQFVVAGSKLIEDAIGCLYYAGPGAAELLIKVSKSESDEFTLAAEEIRKTEDQGEVFEWEALVAWKALGESRG